MKIKGRDPGEDFLFKLSARLAIMARKSFEDAESDAEKSAAASHLVKVTLQAASIFVGSDAMRLFYGESPDFSGSRSDQLARLALRLGGLIEFVRHFEAQDDLSSVQATINEALAVSGGDAPRLYARIARKKGAQDSFKLSRQRLRALEWEAFLSGRNFEPGWVQSQISLAFLNTPWPTIRSWRKQVDRDLGEAVVNFHLELARHADSAPFMGLFDEEAMMEALEYDGLVYGAAKRDDIILPPPGSNRGG